MKNNIAIFFQIVARIVVVLGVLAFLLSFLEKFCEKWKPRTITHIPYGPYEKYFKRPFDLFCGMTTLVALWWLYIILAVLVKRKLGSPVLFKQNRPGKNEKTFTLYKFRSMTEDKDKNGRLLPDEVRLTKFGRILRSSSLDELPEVFNILKGDMSVVGPRPLTMEYLPYYNERERQRHNIQPGLTGAAQVHGRNALLWEERFNYDVKYVNKITFLGDLEILFVTIKKVLRQEGVLVRGTTKSLDDFDVYRKKQMGCFQTNDWGDQNEKRP